MEKLKPLDHFFTAVKNDGRISITHIGVYASIVQYWQQNDCKNPIVAFSHQVNEIAKITTRTYRKCLKELSDYGYLKYMPSLKRNKASEIHLPIYDD